VFIVCIRTDVLKSSFKFPPEIPLTKRASSLVDTSLHGNIDTLTNFEYNNLNTHRRDMLEKKGADIMKDYYFFDIGATASFGKPMKEIVPTLKATRSNYYITKLCRKLTTSEIQAVQGFPQLDIVVSESQYQKQLGNSVCVPLLTILFKEILNAVKF
jgi:site-specific DNA-cytosine methylase